MGVLENSASASILNLNCSRDDDGDVNAGGGGGIALAPLGIPYDAGAVSGAAVTTGPTGVVGCDDGASIGRMIAS